MESRASGREHSYVADISSSSFLRTLTILLAAGGASLLVAGCGPKRVRADFRSYENSYAVTSNREELLNLARLEQHDPTYFFKLGQINSSYRMQASLNGSGSYVTQGTAPGGGNATGGGTPGFIYENDPSFTMIPVSDEANAQILLRPVNAEVFYSLYLQSWRLDQLFRLTVDRIEFTLPEPDPDRPGQSKGCQVKVIRNLPPPSVNGPDYTNDQFALASYIEFLRVSAVIYALQRHGLLLLRATPSFQAFDQKSYLPNKGDNHQSAAAGADPPDASSEAAPSKSSPGPTAKEFDEVAAKGEVWELQGDVRGQGGNWFLGTNSIEPKFQLTNHVEQSAAEAGYVAECDDKTDENTSQNSAPKCQLPHYGKNVEKIKELLLKDFEQPSNGMQELLRPADQNGMYIGGPDLTEILEIIYNGFSIEESSADQDAERKLCLDSSDPRHASNRISARLVMRSLIGLMAAAAQEQGSFDQLEQSNPDLARTNPGTLSELQALVTDFYTAAHYATTGQNPKPEEMTSKLGQLQSQLQQAGAHFNDLVPKIEQIPVLKLTWKDGELEKAQNSKSDLEALGLAVDYRRQNFLITDPKLEDSSIPQNAYWNRDMFRLINELGSQVSVDISKFPLPEILQLRTE